MGLHQSSQLQDFVAETLLEEPIATLLSQEIQSLTYEQFIKCLGELNQLAHKCLDSQGQQLVFAVKKGTETTIFWKATVQIACVNIDPDSKEVSTYRLLNLSEFLKVFKTLKCQLSAEAQSRQVMSVSQVLEKGSEASESTKECCICFERKQDVILPCMHSYCSKCIEEWNASHDTCPICRAKLDSPDDTWVISEVPKAEDISKEIQSSLMELTEHK